VWQVLQNNVQPEDIMVVATHRPMQAMKLANRVIVMQQGEIVHDGRPQDVLQQWMARRAGGAGGQGGPGASTGVARPGAALGAVQAPYKGGQHVV
jgi:ATP-binding cassette subfamily C protein LapB